MNANLDTNNSCLLPYYPLPYNGIEYSDGFADLFTGASWASFVNCSRAIANNSWYKPVACLSSKNSHVYVRADNDIYPCKNIGVLPPYCRILNMIPFGVEWSMSDLKLHDASYDDIMEFIRMGFTVMFPFRFRGSSTIEIINNCVSDSKR
jgi:hypothetical protein